VKTSVKGSKTKKSPNWYFYPIFNRSKQSKSFYSPANMAEQDYFLKNLNSQTWKGVWGISIILRA